MAGPRAQHDLRHEPQADPAKDRRAALPAQLASRHDAELAIIAWIEGWYKPERIIAGLGMRSPDEYEAAFYADNTNPDTTVKVGNPETSLQ
jgi:transposase InsO family protein